MTPFEIIERLKRIETKLVRFAEELGIDTEARRDWLTVDVPSHTIYLSTIGRSLQVIKMEAVRRGAPEHKNAAYDVVHRGETVCVLYI